MKSALLSTLITALCYSAGIAQDIEVPVGGNIQDAIDLVATKDKGGSVILKSGTHHIDEPLRLKSNVTLKGEGELASTLKTAENIKMITANGNGLKNLAISNLVLIGTNALKGGGIHLVSYKTDHEQITVSSVHVQETGWGVHIKGATGVTIENCKFHRNGTAGKEGYAHNLYLRRCTTARVTNSTFTDSISSNGINISYCKDISVVGCRVTGNHFRGIRAADTDGFLVHDCIISSNGTVGLLANTEKVVTKDIDWQNNRVFNNGAEGIYARKGATGICKNNNAYGNKKGDYHLPSTVVSSANISNPKQAHNDS
jgi:parallel beta-helix repeat protein